MENKNKLNPLVSGGILVNDNDYFEKDNVNMEKDSLKASLALLTKLKNQKKNEINTLQNSYLKEEIPVEEKPNSDMYDMPVLKNDNVQDVQNVSPLSKTSFVVPDDAIKPTTTFSVDISNNNEAPVQQNNFEQQQSFGISLQDLDNNNQNELLGNNNKDEYVPDYRSEEYQAQSTTDQIQTPMYSVNQTDTVDINQFITDSADMSAPQEEPIYVVDEKKGRRKGHDPVSTNEEIKEGKSVAWLAYIIFFIPLLFKGKNAFVRWHANEGIELFLLDILGAGLFCVGWFVKSTNEIYTLLLLASLTAGTVIIALSVFTRIIMIPFALAGKEVQHPWLFHKHRIIK